MRKEVNTKDAQRGVHFGTPPLHLFYTVPAELKVNCPEGAREDALGHTSAGTPLPAAAT